MTPPNTAEIVAVVFVDTAFVVIVKVADWVPAAMMTEPGTVAFAEVELNGMDSPPVGAFPLRVAVPVDEVPPVTVAGLTDTLDRVAGVIVRVA